MEIILAKDYPSLGFVGDTVQVKSGYARNYLIPGGIAVEASSRNASQLKHKLEGIMAVKKSLKTEAEAKAEELKALNLSVKLKVGQGGKSFGSIGSRDVEKLLADKGVTISRKQIQLFEPIKTVGEFPIPVKLHSEVVGEIQLNVIADKVAEKKVSKKKEEPGFEEVDEEAVLAEEIAAAEGDSDESTDDSSEE